MRIGFPTLLALLFIGLKLGHQIVWPWIWVLSPIWIPVAIGLSIAGFALVMAVITGQVRGFRIKKGRSR